MPITVLGGTKVADTTFEVANSCRFNDDDDAHLHKTPGSAGNRAKWTFSAWIKCGRVSGAQQILLNAYSASTNESRIFISSAQRLGTYNWVSNSADGNYETSRLLRDPSAWYHVVVSWDSDNATAGDRIKMYINGTEETSFNTESNPSSGSDSFITSDVKHWVASNPDDQAFDGYMAEVCLCDGQTYAASDFGEYDDDSPSIWKPKDVSGLTFGTNGFYLDFEDSSNMGNDASGGTDLTEVNFSAGSLPNIATDTPSNNFCTFNVLNPSFTGTNSEGNLAHLSSSSAWRAIYGTIPFTTGKWYAEFKMVADGSSAGPGVINIDVSNLDTFRLGETNRGVGQGENAVAYLDNAQILDGGNTIKTGQTTFTDGDILGVAIDATNGFIYWSKGGTFMDGAKSGTTAGDPTSGGSGTGGYPLADLVSANGTYLFGYGGDDAWNIEANFGGCPAFVISSGNTDADGHGNFEYSVPSGYFALCTKNLAEYG